MGQLRDKAFELMQEKNYSEAVLLLLQLHDEGADDQNIYHLIGNCYRYLDNYPLAIHYLKTAVEKDANCSNLLALGIAYQLNQDYDLSIKTLEQSIKVDYDYLLAYNSLAMTYKRMGQYQKAVDIHKRALNIIGYQIVSDMKNSRDSEYIEEVESDNTLWFNYAMEAAVYLTKRDKIDEVATLANESAQIEQEDRIYESLYWVDKIGEDGMKRRLFLPNYFNTFRKKLTDDGFYASFTGDRGLNLELLGDLEEVDVHLEEAKEFMDIYESRATYPGEKLYAV